VALAAVLTVVLVPVVPAGVPVLAAASAAVVVGFFARSRQVDGDAENRSAGAVDEEPA
jgi:hypothetical protein